jgi:antitoxin component YwqK of YwqJK toxin-antitoxin module
MLNRIFIALLLLFTVIISACNDNMNVRTKEIKNDKGELQKIVYYVSDEIVKEERFYPSGKIKLKGEYKNGKKNGLWIYYYESGNIWSKGEFTNDVRNGIAEVYYENGKPRYKGQYKNGKETGKWFFYNASGKLIKEHNFDTK